MLAIILIALLAFEQPSAKSSAEILPVAPPVPPLPNGPLLLFAGNGKAANFVDIEHSSKSGTFATVWMFSRGALMQPRGDLGEHQ